MRKEPFVTGEIYHLYNRGTDKRDIVLDKKDRDRFVESILKFNTLKPIGSIYENSFRERKKLGHPMSKLDLPLVEFIAFSLNRNHYHFLVKQLSDNGIEKFIQKFGNGYTKYFNNKYNRSGVLYQGKFKSIHVDSDQYLMHLSVYINFNNQLSGQKSSLTLSSLEYYLGGKSVVPCVNDIIMDRFNRKGDYGAFARTALEVIEKNKRMETELDKDKKFEIEENPENVKTWTSDVQVGKVAKKEKKS